VRPRLSTLVPADSRDVFCAVSPDDAERGQAGAAAPASVRDAVSDATTPRWRPSKRTPAFVKTSERARCAVGTLAFDDGCCSYVNVKRL
jgi:hypothetical protein